MSQDDVIPTGYDKEELYFYELNKKLIESRRAELNENRRQQEHNARQELHWMKCPKCGEDMEEVELTGIKVDRCTYCKGLFFDRGELELLLECQEHPGFWDRLKIRLHRH